VAGGVVGLGAAEAERRVLDVESQHAIVRAEIDSRLRAARTYEEHGSRAAVVRSEGTRFWSSSDDEVGGHPARSARSEPWRAEHSDGQSGRAAELRRSAEVRLAVLEASS
jgi:hypothetical protein